MRIAIIGGAAAAILLLCLAAPAAQAAPARHCGDITGNQTWDTGSNPHTICSAGATVRNGTITIAAGTILMMEEGANLVFAEGGGMQALGDANGGKIRVIAAQGEQPGYWGQFLFKEGSIQGEVNGMDFRYGGKGNVPMVEVRGAPLLFDIHYDVVQDPPVEFHSALGVPLAMRANLIGPGLEAPGQLTVGGQCTRVVVSGNGQDRIAVLAESPQDVTDTQIWHNFCVPYLVSDPVSIGSPTEPLLEIDYGTTLEMEDDGGFVAGIDAENTGQFAVMGTPDKPVLITGREKAAGSWGSIQFTEWSTGGEESEVNSLMSCTIEYGGRGSVPMVQVRTTNVIAYETQMNRALAQPVAIVPAAVGAFMSGLTRSSVPAFNENGVNRIMVLAKETPVDVPKNADWGNAGAPYQIDGDLLVANEQSTPLLTLRGNARLLFDRDAALIVGDPTLGNGSLRIEGYITDSVTLSGSDGAPGSWSGLKITNDAESVSIDRATIEYGGSSQAPMVDWGRAPGKIVRSTLRNAPGYPFAVLLSRLEVIMDEEQRPEYRNQLIDNGVSRFLVRSDGVRGQSQIKWSDPGAPVEFDGDVVIGSPTRPLLVAYDGLTMLFRPGAHLQLGASAQDRAVMQVRNDVPNRPVMFGAADSATGWGGVRILRDSALSGSEMVFSGAAADAANVSVESGTFDVDNVLFKGSKRGTGLAVGGEGALADVSLGTFNDYRIGVNTANRGRLELSRSTVSGNSEWGVRNEDPALCQVVSRVYWGAPTGPVDPSDAKDGCMNAANASPNADKVSDDVDWWPYALDNVTYPPASGIGPNAKLIFLPVARKD